MNWIDPFIGWLGVWFQPGVAGVLALCILLAAVTICAWQSFRMRTLDRALRQLNAALTPVRNAPDDGRARLALHDHYQQIVRAAHDCPDIGLRRAWSEFEESIIDLQAPVLTNSVRPDEFFHGLGERSRGLLWWANIAVAVGLVLTFLGIIAALGTTATALGAGTDPKAMQAALKQLLNVTAAKFLTSAAGVLASIVLRGWDLHLQRRTREALHQFVDGLERGLAYLPPQRIAADQLHHLEQIATAQTKFATELAAAIGDKFNEQITPMVTVLGEINGSIGRLKDDMVGGLSDKVGRALGDSAGKEMQAMAAALTTMTERLTVIPERLNASAGDANARIEAAAQLFSQASAGMSAAFDALGSKIEAMGDAVVTKQREAFDGFSGQVRDATLAYGDAATGGAAAVASAGAEIRTLVEQVGSTLSSIAGQLAAQSAAGSEATREAAESARQTLAEASRQAGTDFARAAAAGAKEAADLSADLLEAALENFTRRFEAAGLQLTNGIDASTGRMQAFGGSLERVTERSDAQVDRLAAAGLSAERLGGVLAGAATEAVSLLGKASTELASASNPVREASEAIADGVEEVAAALKAQREAVETQTAAWRTMAAHLDTIVNAAQQAWKSYVDRFEQVDQSLAGALAQVTQAAAESAEQLNRYAKQVDDNLGNAVNRLTSVVDGLADLPEAIQQASRRAEAT